MTGGQSTIRSKAGKLDVVGLPVMPKVLAVIFVQVPLVSLELSLAMVGMKFLMYCNALGKLLMKAMSLSYIETVSAVVFVTLKQMFPVPSFHSGESLSYSLILK